MERATMMEGLKECARKSTERLVLLPGFAVDERLVLHVVWLGINVITL